MRFVVQCRRRRQTQVDRPLASAAELALLADYAKVLGLKCLMGKNGRMLQSLSQELLQQAMEDLEHLRQTKMEARNALEGLTRMGKDPA